MKESILFLIIIAMMIWQAHKDKNTKNRI